MNIKDILKTLNDDELYKLYKMLNEYTTFSKVILMIFVSCSVPFIALGIYNKYNNEVINVLIVLIILTIIIRYFFDNKIVENIIIILFGIFYSFLLLSIEINLPYFILPFIIGGYFYGTKIIKKKTLIAWINRYIELGLTGTVKLNHVLILSSGAILPTLLSDNMENIILILLSYILSMGSLANVFNTYYLKDQKEELINRNIIKK
ncbi:MAG: hypothetical protein ACK5HR_06355 [Mycoplasmatales bacterium]